MKDWSDSFSKPVRKEKVEKRMGRVQNLLNYLDGSKTHYLSKQNCVDFDTILPTTVVEDFNAYAAATNNAESFGYLKEHVQLCFTDVILNYH